MTSFPLIPKLQEHTFVPPHQTTSCQVEGHRFCSDPGRDPVGGVPTKMCCCHRNDPQVRRNAISGWWFGTCFIFPLILGISSSQLTNSYFSEGWPNHQPDINMPWWDGGSRHHQCHFLMRFWGFPRVFVVINHPEENGEFMAAKKFARPKGRVA